MREAVAGGRDLPSALITSRSRQVTAFVRVQGRLPAGLSELEAVPRAARMLLLSACDGQQATIVRGDDPRRALLRLQLPCRQARRSGHTTALGVDWGLNTLLSAGAARLHGDGRITALGAGGMFRTAGGLARVHRLRRNGEHLHAENGHCRQLIG
ncbi:hypothetical protein ABZ313_13845 [Streptomyces sp. NPDC006251]|uniref:hypothetical protein n=1 Tax=Streptomyces sp. NPDC006251 TaxID=3155718 RepID=UPI0033BE9527